MRQWPGAAPGLAEQRATERAIERIALSKEGLAQELLAIVMANMADYFKFDEVGNPHLDLAGCTRAQMKAIKSIQIEEIMDAGGVELRMRRTKIQLREPVPAAITIARLFSWIIAPPRPEPPTPLEQRLRAMTLEQRRQDAKELYAQIQARLNELPPSAVEAADCSERDSSEASEASELMAENGVEDDAVG